MTWSEARKATTSRSRTDEWQTIINGTKAEMQKAAAKKFKK